MSSCSKILCDKGIYDKTSHRKALLALKQEKGVGFEQDTDYKILTNCLSEVGDTYKTQKQCQGNSTENPNEGIWKANGEFNDDYVEKKYGDVFAARAKYYQQN